MHLMLSAHDKGQARHLSTVVIGLGNTMLGDEGVGVHVVNLLRNRPLPPSVVLLEGGVGALDILPDIMESDSAVIIDAAKMGLLPGQVKSFTIDKVDMENSPMLSLHDLALPEAIKLGQIISKLPPMLLIGVEPLSIAPSERLSDEVQQSLPAILEFVYKAILDFTEEVVN